MTRSIFTPDRRLHTRAVPDTIPAEMLRRHVVDDRLSIRAAADTGAFEGFALLWDTVDAYGTTFARGSVAAGGLDAELYALLAMHEPGLPIGTFTAEERDAGLWIAGTWDDTTEGRDWRTRAKSGSAGGLSVGFVPLMVDPDDPNRFTQVRLVEVSQITARMAAVPGAAFAGVRKAPSATTPDDGDDIEQRGRVAAALLALRTV